MNKRNFAIFKLLFATTNSLGWSFSPLPILKRKAQLSYLSSIREEVQYEIQKENHILIPPTPLQSLHLHEEIAPLASLPDLKVTRLSFDPPIFLLQNFLPTPTEQLSMIMGAVNKGMEYSGTKSGNIVSQRYKSYTSWIHPDDRLDDSEEISDVDDDFDTNALEIAHYMTEISALLFFPEHLSTPNSSKSVIAEAVQVVRYELGGNYSFHHDGFNRFLSVLSYLNGIAGTWFPYAIVDQNEFIEAKNGHGSKDVPDISMDNVAQDKVPGKDGLLVVGSEYEHNEKEKVGVGSNHIVKVNPGDAIVFYGYDWIETNQQNATDSIMEDGDFPPTGPLMNYRSIHTGLTADKDEKWIATNWFRLDQN